MMVRPIAALLDWCRERRRQAWAYVSGRAAAAQEATLLQMVRMVRRTDFGRAHGFDGITSIHLPRDPGEIARILDETLMSLNTDYRIKRNLPPA